MIARAIEITYYIEIIRRKQIVRAIRSRRTHPERYNRKWPWRARASGRADLRGSGPERRNRPLPASISAIGLLSASERPRGCCARTVPRPRDWNTERRPL